MNCALFEPLAQSAEHLTFNQRVWGSNPQWLTRNRQFFRTDGFFVMIRKFQTATKVHIKEAKIY